MEIEKQTGFCLIEKQLFGYDIYLTIYSIQILVHPLVLYSDSVEPTEKVIDRIMIHHWVAYFVLKTTYATRYQWMY